jgi:hypothetical protein
MIVADHAWWERLNVLFLFYCFGIYMVCVGEWKRELMSDCAGEWKNIRSNFYFSNPPSFAHTTHFSFLFLILSTLYKHSPISFFFILFYPSTLVFFFNLHCSPSPSPIALCSPNFFQIQFFIFLFFWFFTVICKHKNNR